MTLLSKNDPHKRETKPLQSYSREEKKQKWHLKAEVLFTVRSCTQPAAKDTVRAYQRFEGVRDATELQYMRKRYGTEFPAKLTHIPLVKSMVQAVVGLKREQPYPFAITCRDSKSIDQMNKNKLEAMMAVLRERAASDISRQIDEVLNPVPPEQAGMQPQPKMGEQGLKEVVEQFKTWQDQLEINGHHLFKFAQQKLDMEEKEESLLLDALIAGQAYYQCKVEQEDQMPAFRTLDPRRTFYQRSTDKRWVKECDRARYQTEMHVIDIINRWGHEMTADERESLLSCLPGAGDTSSDVYDMRLIEYSKFNAHPNHFKTVNYCEWKSNNTEQVVNSKGQVETRYRLDRYEGYLIGSDIFVGMKEAEHVVRPVDNPWYCDLTINGAVHAVRDGKPQMLVIETIDLQDKYDLMFMHWENIVALSGTKAIMVDTADIPKWMGTNESERFINWIGYLKQGVAAVDRSQKGNMNGKFGNMGDVDLSLNQSVSVILDMIRFIEETASRVVGVPRQMVGQLTQYDGKATAEMAQAGGSLVTKPLISFHQDVMRQAYTDIINNCRYAFRKGLRGAYVLGDRSRKVFSIDGGRHALADYDVHLNDSGLEQRQLTDLKLSMKEMMAGQLIDVETFVDGFTMQSLTEFRGRLKEGIAKQQEQGMSQLQQQLQQAMEQLKQKDAELQQFDAQQQQLEQKKLALEEQHLASKLEIEQQKVDVSSTYNTEKLALDRERVRLEGLQMSYSAKSMEVRND
jgi:hypothetical protein